MAQKKLSTVTHELIASYANTAKNVINAYRVGNARAVGYVDHSWAAAVKKAGKRISPEVRTNAVAAQKKLTALYTQGVTLSSDSADSAVNKAVELAGKGLEQVAANASRFEKSTGLNTLNTIAVATVPAAVAVGQVAAKLEAKSDALVSKIAGSAVKAKTATAKRTVANKVSRVRKAA